MALLLTNPKTGHRFMMRKKPPMPPKTLGSRYVAAPKSEALKKKIT